MTNLAQITKKLGSIHAKSKKLEKEIKEQRVLFFEGIDEEIESHETLARQTISTPPDLTFPQDDQDILHYIKKFYPGWRLVDCGSEEHTYIIEEDPSYKKFVYINHDDGNIYRRNIAQGSPYLDDERLKSEDPELWNRVSETRVQEVTVLKDFDSLPNEDLDQLKEYFVPGPITVKLDAPRKAKPEELNA